MSTVCFDGKNYITAKKKKLTKLFLSLQEHITDFLGHAKPYS